MSIGKGVIKAGDNSTVIKSEKMMESSIVLLTELNTVKKDVLITLSLVLREKKKGSFEVFISEKSKLDITFNWLILNN